MSGRLRTQGACSSKAQTDYELNYSFMFRRLTLFDFLAHFDDHETSKNSSNSSARTHMYTLDPTPELDAAQV